MPSENKDKSVASLSEILESLRQEYWRGLSETGELKKKEGVELLTFWMGEEHYGVDLTNCRHILKVPKLVPIPQVPKFILGIFNLQGEIIPVLDLRKMFGMESASLSEKSRLLVVEIQGITTALLIDQIGDIVFGEWQNLQKITKKEGWIPSQYLKGYFLPSQEQEKLLIYLDLEKLLSQGTSIS